jgi:hypothetical protein
MPLRDHFRPPLSLRRHWHAFHNGWASSIAADLNTRLPDGYFAEPNVQFGIEIDVAAFEEGSAGALGVAQGTAWAPPSPALTVPLPMLTDLVEVAVYNAEAGPVLAGAIELVSPSNKDRPSHREAFLAKCRSYLQEGVGLVIVDIVTDRRADLHALLLEQLDEARPPQTTGADLYASGYRPIGRGDRTWLDIWHEPISPGISLPTVPLWLRGGLCLPVDLDASSERTCREQRIS